MTHVPCPLFGNVMDLEGSRIKMSKNDVMDWIRSILYFLSVKELFKWHLTYDICRVHIQWEEIKLKPVFYIMNLKPNSIWKPEKCPVSMSEIVLVCCCILKISLSQHQITAAYWCQEWTTQMGRMISWVKNFGHKTLGQNYDFSYLITPIIIDLHNLQWNKFINSFML